VRYLEVLPRKAYPKDGVAHGLNAVVGARIWSQWEA
jgi:hypothetical protein